MSPLRRHDPDADVWTARTWVGELDDTGELIWDRSYDTTLCRSVAVDDDDFAYLAGETEANAWVAKISP